jgi:hypothetical protein
MIYYQEIHRNLFGLHGKSQLIRYGLYERWHRLGIRAACARGLRDR